MISAVALLCSNLSFSDLLDECIEPTRCDSPCLAITPTPMYIFANDGTAVPVLEINSRIINTRIDCRFNNLMYVFKNHNPWYWLPSSSVDLVLVGDGWKPIEYKNCAHGDIVVVRKNLQVKSMFYVEGVIENNNTHQMSLSYKINDQLPQLVLAHFPFPQSTQMGLDVQVWSNA